MEVELVTKKTPFYGESGGQAGDTGTITTSNNDHAFLMEVTDTIKDPTGLIVHKGMVISGKIQRGIKVTLSLDMEKRNATASNHTATHILHHALRKVLGEHVKQAGSLVAPDRFRFDFTHFSQVGPDLLDEIESIVNQRIRDNVPVQTEEMDAEDAFKSGATALFEEKYGDRVRVVSLADFSMELCGGTHTKQTGNIGMFKIISESSIASGVRRIEALTGEAALNHLQGSAHIIQEAAGILRVKPDAVPRRIQKLLEQLKGNEKDINQLKAKILGRAAPKVKDEIIKVNGLNILVKKVDADSPAALRNIADRFKEQLKSGIIVLGSQSGSKALLLTAVTRDLTGQYHAGKIVNKLAAIVGGGGGGRPDMAQAGGPNPENLDKALEAAVDIVAEIS
jgi:alanyl-tRNA synthetase